MSYKLHVQKLALVLQTSVEPPNWLKSNVQVDENPMLSPEIQMWNFICVTYFFLNCFTESDLKTAHGSGFLYLEAHDQEMHKNALFFEMLLFVNEDTACHRDHQVSMLTLISFCLVFYLHLSFYLFFLCS